MRRLCAAAVLGVLPAVLLAAGARGDFVLPSFNVSELEGPPAVSLVGSASVQQCGTWAHGATYPGTTATEVLESRLLRTDSVRVRNDTVPASCESSLRLTWAAPNETGAAWHVARQKVEAGFVTRFRFRAHTRSESCRRLEQVNEVGTVHYDLCSSDLGPWAVDGASGGEGFAFVLHRAPAAFAAAGEGGASLGYGGINNSLAVEFDTRSDAGGAERAHVSVHSRGAGANSAATSGRVVGADAPTALLNDGAEHEARIALYPSVRHDLVASGVVSPSPAAAGWLTPRTQTLCVHVDDMVTPLVCTLLDVTAALDLSGGEAYVGFTAANGDGWQAHDILGWEFCEGSVCAI